MLGKRIGLALYLHRGALPYASPGIVEATQEAAGIYGNANGFNVVKLEGKPIQRVSLLTYDGFDAHPFPALRESLTVDLQSRRTSCRSYRKTANPPILHRKELLLPPDDPRRERFAELTQELEERGLFENNRNIGFKQQWEKRLAEHGIAVRDHHVVELEQEGEACINTGVEVDRHKTAISRGQLSAPMQALARHGFLDGNYNILDYGCGRGDDVAVLEAAGVRVIGWDPYYRPDAPLGEADVVNLGYVINVIEDPSERMKTIEEAFALARQCLAIAIIPAGRTSMVDLRPYGDGFLSSRGTFQKYFRQEEIRQLIEEATGQEALAIAPGIFFVFRDKIAEQEFLSGRSRQQHDISHLLSMGPTGRAKAEERTTPHEEQLVEENRELLDGLWGRALELGRLPAMDELPRDIVTGIEQTFGSIRRATRLARTVHDGSTLTEVADARMKDLRVYFALNIFNRRRRYRSLPVGLQRDVKAFFGSYGKAEASGRELLYSLGEPETIGRGCRAAAEQGLGYLFGDHSLQLHASLVSRLPAALRAYIGCAERLFGEISSETADLVKIHIHSGKVTLLRYDDFDGRALPVLRERIKIKMRSTDIDFFDYTTDEQPPRLTMKSRYMAAEQPGYEKQRAFDNALESLGYLDLTGLGPSTAELDEGLRRAGYRVSNFSIVRDEEYPGPVLDNDRRYDSAGRTGSVGL